MTGKARIVLCDDHPIVLAGLRTLVEAESDLELGGEATDGLAALKLIRELLPDVAILDISMPQLNGVMLARRLAAECPTVRIIMLTLHEEPIFAKQALESGACGYVLKRSAAENLIQAIRTVLSGERYLDPIVAAEVSAASATTAVDRPRSESVGAITTRESAVLKLVARGHPNKEIARRLDIGIKSVETYKSRGLEKLGLRTRAELVRYAAAQGWLEDI